MFGRIPCHMLDVSCHVPLHKSAMSSISVSIVFDTAESIVSCYVPSDISGMSRLTISGLGPGCTIESSCTVLSPECVPAIQWRRSEVRHRIHSAPSRTCSACSDRPFQWHKVSGRHIISIVLSKTCFAHSVHLFQWRRVTVHHRITLRTYSACPEHLYSGTGCVPHKTFAPFESHSSIPLCWL